MRSPANLALLLEGFFIRRLMAQRRASPHTIGSYRDTFRLLLNFAEKRLKRPPSKLALEDLGTPLITSFLDELEKEGPTLHAVATFDWRRSGPFSAMPRWRLRSIRP